MSDDQLNWLAMQYVLGELPELDCNAFEERMAEDLLACEAVANASRLYQAIRLASVDSVTVIPLNQSDKMPVRRSSLAVGSAIATLACLFIVVIFWPGESEDSRFARVPSTSGAELKAAELVSIWRGEMTDTESEIDDVEDDLQEVSADLSIPAWLLAGVSLETNGAVDGPSSQLKDN